MVELLFIYILYFVDMSELVNHSSTSNGVLIVFVVYSYSAIKHVKKISYLSSIYS